MRIAVFVLLLAKVRISLRQVYLVVDFADLLLRDELLLSILKLDSRFNLVDVFGSTTLS